MTREELDELEIIIRDLRMAMDIKEQIEAGEERGLVNFADGTRITIPIPQAKKEQLDNKISELTNLLQVKGVAIKEMPKVEGG